MLQHKRTSILMSRSPGAGFSYQPGRLDYELEKLRPGGPLLFSCKKLCFIQERQTAMHNQTHQWNLKLESCCYMAFSCRLRSKYLSDVDYYQRLVAFWKLKAGSLNSIKCGD